MCYVFAVFFIELDVSRVRCYLLWWWSGRWAGRVLGARWPPAPAPSRPAAGRGAPPGRAAACGPPSPAQLRGTPSSRWRSDPRRGSGRWRRPRSWPSRRQLRGQGGRKTCDAVSLYYIISALFQIFMLYLPVPARGHGDGAEVLAGQAHRGLAGRRRGALPLNALA